MGVVGMPLGGLGLLLGVIDLMIRRRGNTARLGMAVGGVVINLVALIIAGSWASIGSAFVSGFK